MSMERLNVEDRIVITGYGSVTALGLDSATSWDAIVCGQSGVRALDAPLEGFPYDVHAVAQVQGFDNKVLMERAGVKFGDIKRDHRAGHYALLAASEALQMAQLSEENSMVLKEGIDRTRVGIAIGSGAAGADQFVHIGGMIRDPRPSVIRELEKMLEDNENALSETQAKLIESWLSENRTKNPKPAEVIPALPCRMATSPSMRIVAEGPLISAVGACGTGNMNIIAGIQKILAGSADIIVAGSSEAQTRPEALAMFDGITALDRSPDPSIASRPFHRAENGFVMGEGAGAVVLERLSTALERRAHIYAEVVGYGETADAFDDTMLNKIGSARALRNALVGSEDAEAIYINAHATGTGGDKLEMQVIKEVLDKGRVVGVSSTKGATGHGVGAAGSIETVLSIHALNSGIIPPTLKLDDPVDDAKGWDLSPNEATKTDGIDMVVNHSFGFGGINCVIALRNYAER